MMARVVALAPIVWLGFGPALGTLPQREDDSNLTQARPPLEVTYIANEGFLVSAGSSKALIDALHENPWGYENTPPEVFERMQSNDPPFDGVDLLVASHGHADHFDPGLVHEYLATHPEVTFVGSAATVAMLQDSTGQRFTEVEDRVTVVNPAWGETGEISVGSIKARFLTLNHSDSDTERVLTLGSLLELDGRTILHLADLVPETSAAFLQRYDFTAEEIDMAFVDPYFLSSEVGQDLLRSHIRPAHIVLMHVRPPEREDVLERVRPSFPDVILFMETMETRVFD
jgi:L-ascorbate metabolism protein UlaG (beta-lactamase superfamily)